MIKNIYIYFDSESVRLSSSKMFNFKLIISEIIFNVKFINYFKDRSRSPYFTG